MKTYEIQYMNYEGNTPTTTVNVDDDKDENDAQIKAIEEDRGWGDGIMTILSIQQIS